MARTGFGPTVLAGLATAAATAVASNQTWFTATPAEPGVVYAELDTGAQVPLALTLSLVVLAAWGVLLVTRRVVRRGVAVLALLAALGAAAATALGRRTATDALRQDFREIGATAVVDVSWWWWLAVVTSVLAVLPAAVAVRRVAAWPEMGSRYDAPVAQGAERLEDPSSLDLWKAIDEGRDPTG